VSPDESPLLEVAGLRKRFGRLLVVEDVSFTVTPGQVLGIIGPNGAGKTTLLNLISGVLRPEAGSIGFAGRDVTRTGPADRARAGIGRSYQVPRPLADMTVLENVLVAATFAARSRQPDANALAIETLDRTGLTDLANEPAGSLRLLDRKRLELARALATAPRLVLLDEIAGGLTDQELPTLVNTVTELRSSGLAVVWIEHIVHALLAVVDRLLCLTSGQVLAVGAPRDVLRSERVITAYLGSTLDTEGAGDTP